MRHYPLIGILLGLIGIATGVFIVRTPSRAMRVLMPSKVPDDPSTSLLRVYRVIGFVGGLLSILLVLFGPAGLRVVLG